MDNETYQALRIVYSAAKEHLRDMPSLGTHDAAELGYSITMVSNYMAILQGKPPHGTHDE